MQNSASSSPQMYLQPVLPAAYVHNQSSLDMHHTAHLAGFWGQQQVGPDPPHHRSMLTWQVNDMSLTNSCLRQQDVAHQDFRAIVYCASIHPTCDIYLAHCSLCCHLYLQLLGHWQLRPAPFEHSEAPQHTGELIHSELPTISKLCSD